MFYFEGAVARSSHSFISVFRFYSADLTHGPAFLALIQQKGKCGAALSPSHPPPLNPASSRTDIALIGRAASSDRQRRGSPLAEPLRCSDEMQIQRSAGKSQALSAGCPLMWRGRERDIAGEERESGVFSAGFS